MRSFVAHCRLQWVPRAITLKNSRLVLTPWNEVGEASRERKGDGNVFHMATPRKPLRLVVANPLVRAWGADSYCFASR